MRTRSMSRSIRSLSTPELRMDRKRVPPRLLAVAVGGLIAGGLVVAASDRISAALSVRLGSSRTATEPTRTLQVTYVLSASPAGG